MKHLILLAVVVFLGVTGAFVAGVELREHPPVPRQLAATETVSEVAVPRAADRSAEANEFSVAPVAGDSVTARAEGERRRPEELPAVAGLSRKAVRELPADSAADAGISETEPVALEGLAPSVSGNGPGVDPTFDIVRVKRTGDAVIAGRAEPGSAVRIMDGDHVIGTTRSDRRGEWVVVPDRPLGPGTREIGIEATRDDGPTRRSESVVVVSRPDRMEQTPDRTTGAASAVAVLVPREGVRPSILLQPPGEPPVIVGAGNVDYTGASDSLAESGTAKIATIRPSPEPSSDEPSSYEPSRPTAAQAGDGLSVETVDYDEAGRVALSGRAAAGAHVDVFLDEARIGQAVANASGRWEMTPGEDVPPGRYTLRAEQLTAEGRVAAQVILPFSRADAFRELPPGTIVVVQPGNSLWRIARRTYGDGLRYTLIYRTNVAQIEDPDLIYPGQVFALPETDLPGSR